MAIPIAIVPKTTKSTIDVESELEAARVAHAQAILRAYQLLQELYDAGILDLARGAVAAGDTLVTKLAVAAGSEEAIAGTRNLISLGRLLTSIDPDVLHELAATLTATKYKETVAPKPSLWKALSSLFSSDTRRALVGMAAFLNAFGGALAAGKTKR